MKLSNCTTLLLVLVAAACQSETMGSHVASATGPTEYTSFKARNGVEIPYKVFLPDNYAADKTYPALVAFSNMTYDTTLGDELVDLIWGENAFKDYILVVPLAPVNGSHGWMNHPAHHALEDLLDDIMDRHQVAGRQFYSLGYKDGTIPALTWMHMSFKYFNSLVLASCYTLDAAEMADAKKMAAWKKRVVLITGSEDPKGLKQVETFQSDLPKLNPELVSIVSDDDNRSLTRFFDSDFKTFIQEHLSR